MPPNVALRFRSRSRLNVALRRCFFHGYPRSLKTGQSDYRLWENLKDCGYWLSIEALNLMEQPLEFKEALL